MSQALKVKRKDSVEQKSYITPLIQSFSLSIMKVQGQALATSFDLKLQPLEAELLHCTTVLMFIWTSQIYQEFASLRSGMWPRDFMIKTRLCLPNSERPEK